MFLCPVQRTLPLSAPAYLRLRCTPAASATVSACCTNCRSFNFREQQQVAMKLNKQHPSEHYQWWVVTTIALQAHAAAAQAQLQQPNANGTAAAAGGAAAGLGADKLLQLAEAMAARLLSKQQGGGGAASLPSWEAVMLYLGLLQAQVRPQR
jgi:hypothetical protein